MPLRVLPLWMSKLQRIHLMLCVQVACGFLRIRRTTGIMPNTNFPTVPPLAFPRKAPTSHRLLLLLQLFQHWWRRSMTKQGHTSRHARTRASSDPVAEGTWLDYAPRLPWPGNVTAIMRYLPQAVCSAPCPHMTCLSCSDFMMWPHRPGQDK